MRQTEGSKYDVGCRISDGLKSWSRFAERNLVIAGVTLAELRVLRMLSEFGPCSMIGLAKEQGMTAPGMTIIVDKLERAGLARRVRSDVDRRIINVAITGKGGEKLRRGLKLHDRFIEQVMGSVTSQEIDSFLTVLNRMLVAAEDRANSTSRL